MTAPKTSFFVLRYAPRAAQVARMLCYALAVLGALSAVGASLIADRWQETMVQVGWILIGASAVAFLVMLAALWLASHVEADGASAFQDSENWR